MIRTISVAIAAVIALVSPLVAQPDLESILAERRDALPEGRRAFQETWLLPARGEVAPSPDSVRFAGRATVWQNAPKERLEIHRVGNDGQLEDPLVIVSNGSNYFLVTPVGATALAKTVVSDDPLLRAVLAAPPGEVAEHRIVSGPEGGVAAVVLRRSEPASFDERKAFALRLPRGGDGLLAGGVSRFSAAGNPEVTAAAGARGVGRVRTATGTVRVTPDPAAVTWMEQLDLPAAALEEFRMERRLPPYDALPAPPTSPDAADGAGEDAG